MRYLNSRNELTAVTSSMDLRAPELHDFSDLPAIRPHRLLAVAMVAAAVFTAGYFMNGSVPATTADANPPTVIEHQG